MELIICRLAKNKVFVSTGIYAKCFIPTITYNYKGQDYLKNNCAIMIPSTRPGRYPTALPGAGAVLIQSTMGRRPGLARRATHKCVSCFICCPRTAAWGIAPAIIRGAMRGEVENQCVSVKMKNKFIFLDFP